MAVFYCMFYFSSLSFSFSKTLIIFSYSSCLGVLIELSDFRFRHFSTFPLRGSSSLKNSLFSKSFWIYKTDLSTSGLSPGGLSGPAARNHSDYRSVY